MVDPLSYFSFQPVIYDRFNKGHDKCYPVCGMMHIKEPLLLIRKSSLYGRSGFLSRYLCAICVVLYHVYKYISFRARCSSVVRAFAHGAMGRRINPSWGGPIELFLIPASAPRLV